MSDTSTMIAMRNPETGGVGQVHIDQLHQALGDGMQLAQDVPMYNPESGGSGVLKPDQVAEALQHGLLPVGSRAHAVATTGKGESFLRGAAQSASLGFADEATAGLESLFTDKKYKDALAESRANYDTAGEANPGTSMAGGLLGGLASAFIPGLGGASALKSVGGAIKSGIGIGAASGLGNSRADLTTGEGLRQGVVDTAEGGALGGALGGVTHGVMEAGKFVGTKAMGAVKEAFDPQLQPLLALGLKAKDVVGPQGEAIMKSTPMLGKLGIFAKDAEGKFPSTQAMQERLESRRLEAADGLSSLFQKAQGQQLAPQAVEDMQMGLIDHTAQAIHSSEPGVTETLNSKLQEVLGRIEDTGGDLSKLWQLKKDTGSWARFDSTRPPAVAKMYQDINGYLGNMLKDATASIAEPGSTLAQLNAKYAAISNVQGILDKQLAADLTSKGMGSLRQNINGGAIGASVGAMTGNPILGTAAAVGGVVGGAMFNSAEGRLARAAAGQAVHDKMAAAAVASGAIPRTVAGVQSWAQKNMAYIDQAMPQMSQIARRLLTEPPSIAEQTVRTVMPLLTQMMSPSPYLSELNGRVSEPADLISVNRQLDALPGLSPSQLASRKSSLNRHGLIPPEVYAPTQGESFEDEITNYSERLKAMGY